MHVQYSLVNSDQKNYPNRPKKDSYRKIPVLFRTSNLLQKRRDWSITEGFCQKSTGNLSLTSICWFGGSGVALIWLKILAESPEIRLIIDELQCFNFQEPCFNGTDLSPRILELANLRRFSPLPQIACLKKFAARIWACSLWLSVACFAIDIQLREALWPPSDDLFPLQDDSHGV